MNTLVEMTQITKRYGDLVANNGIDLRVNAGEVHSVVGENGAGKSTLMNVLYGMVQPDSGRICVDGREVSIGGPQEAMALGIGMVHQHFMLVPNLTVAENIVLGKAPTRRGLIDSRRARADVLAVSAEYSLGVDPDQRVADMPVGAQQRVEILKALHRGANVLVLDEPTAVLTPQEAVELTRVMRQLTDAGKAVLFISHKLKEVMAVSDQITVLRRGRVTGRFAASETNERELARHMVGREVITTVQKSPAHRGESTLEVAGLTADDDRGQQALKAVSLTLTSGTITGIAGVEGNGQTELIECLAGLRPVQSGSVRIGSLDITDATPRQRRTLGISHVPEDRLKRGLAPNLSISDNLIATTYTSKQFSRFGFIRRANVRRHAEEMIREFEIATTGPAQTVGSLSGGNMQKVVVARELGDSPRVVLISQPTRGVDIGAIENIHRQIVALRDSGAAILLVSAELDEVMALSDDLFVMYDGDLVARLDPAETDETEIGLHMAGLSGVAFPEENGIGATNGSR